MREDLYGQIFESLSQRETEELLAIWKGNDRTEWTETAFTVIREILVNRQVELPEQGPPVNERVAQPTVPAFLQAETYRKLTSEENAPVFYKPLEVLRLVHWLPKVGLAAVLASALSALIGMPALQDRLAPLIGVAVFSPQSWSISFLLVLLSTGIEFVVVYLPLKALALILEVLLEMEYTSRERMKPT